jgi:hypothetical protein
MLGSPPPVPALFLAHPEHLIALWTVGIPPPVPQPHAGASPNAIAKVLDPALRADHGIVPPRIGWMVALLIGNKDAKVR